MIGALLANLIINSTAYYVVLGYSIFSLGFFLVSYFCCPNLLNRVIETEPFQMRSLHVAIQTTSAGHSSPRNGLHVVLIVCLFQAPLMYWLTRQYVGLNTAGAILPKI